MKWIKKIIKRIIESAFLVASIYLLTADSVWCVVAAAIPFAVFLLLIVAWEEDTCDEWLYMK